MVPERPEPIPPNDRGYVDLVQLLVDEFGLSPQVIRSQIMIGTVSIDGRIWEGTREMVDKTQVPYSYLQGKTVAVVGPDRRFVVRYQR